MRRPTREPVPHAVRLDILLEQRPHHGQVRANALEVLVGLCQHDRQPTLRGPDIEASARLNVFRPPQVASYLQEEFQGSQS